METNSVARNSGSKSLGYAFAFLLCMLCAGLTSYVVARNVAIDKIGEREREIIAHYLQKVNKIRVDLGMPPEDPKTIEQLFDALMAPAFEMQNAPKNRQ